MSRMQAGMDPKVGCTPDQHVLIIGAGISGLLLAQGLRKHDVGFSIFELEYSPTNSRSREWGLSLQWALPMLEELLPETLMRRLQSDAAVDPHYFFPETGNTMPVYDASSGELLKNIPLVKMLRVSRRKMRILCAEGINVNYGKQLEQISGSDVDGITVSFADGTTAVGTLIVGADGASSAVRQAAFHNNSESKPSPSGYGGVNMHVCYGNAGVARSIRKHLSPIQAIGVHPRGYWLWLSMQDVRDTDKAEDWSFQLQWTFQLGPGSITLSELDLGKLKAEAADFAEPWRTAWTTIPDGTRVPNNRISVWMPTPIPERAWNGRVALIGDAGHAMTFHRGQGMNHGIADAVNLTKMLVAVQKGDKAQEVAISEYEAEMIKRAGEEFTVSKLNTSMMHDWGEFTQSAFMQRGGDKNK